MKARFIQGDIVRRITGKVPIEIVSVFGSGTSVRCRYCDGRSYDPRVHSTDIRPTKNLVLFTAEDAAKVPDIDRRLNDSQRARMSYMSDVFATPHAEENTDMPKLYQTKEETPRFGVRIGTNSAGLAVLEMKPGGVIEAFAAKDIEEVKPYTVGVKFDGSSTEYHFVSRKGDVAKGDWVLIDGHSDMARVTSVDTKSDKATKPLKGRKVVTEAFGGDVEDAEVLDAE